MNFFPEIPLTTGQAEAMARALFEVLMLRGFQQKTEES